MEDAGAEITVAVALLEPTGAEAVGKDDVSGTEADGCGGGEDMIGARTVDAPGGNGDSSGGGLLGIVGDGGTVVGPGGSEGVAGNVGDTSGGGDEGVVGTRGTVEEGADGSSGVGTTPAEEETMGGRDGLGSMLELAAGRTRLLCGRLMLGLTGGSLLDDAAAGA